MAARTPVAQLPHGQETVSVKLINPVNFGPAVIKRFMAPAVSGVDTFTTSPSLCFLLEHPSGRKLVWDLGIRKDYHNYAPAITSYLPTTKYNIEVTKNLVEILEDDGIAARDVEAVIWSGRNLREISFEGLDTLRIGKFPAFDYFGDGSFYLLDSPGHAVGHLCGLARTSKSPHLPDTFILLGGDVCHYAGIFRPSKHLPVPDSISPHPCHPHDGSSVLCPGSAWDELQESRGRRKHDTLYDATYGLDIPLVAKTVESLQEIDCDENVLVIIAHDSTVRDAVPHFPSSLNAWKSEGWGELVKWGFFRDLEAYWKTKGLY
ncbi:Cytochrome P450 monooxygenase mpaDE [Colletotrichum sidae]|uniref:Cytochrome P450 monooxygenase mpaDE n=1 Tax=Colletotrichum sidae TaxID=1347389 RepID=A0A4R8TTF8_9PEZI|nr:Cytochrome P450 monooxygenase mpaDE [Colletotrichum sidae]